MAISPVPPGEPAVNLSWSTAVIVRHKATVPLETLCDYLDEMRERAGRPHHPDYARDLDLLKNTWLAVHESEIGHYRHIRRITGHDLPRMPRMTVFTVTVDDRSPDEERECPHAYVLHAPNLDTACRLAMERHLEARPQPFRLGDAPPEILTGRWWTFTGVPGWPKDLAGRTWEDLRSDERWLARAYRAGTSR